MYFSEKFTFPKSAYEEFQDIVDSLNAPDADNFRNLPKWFAKKYGIHSMDDMDNLNSEFCFEGLMCGYVDQSGKMSLAFDDVYENPPDIDAICELLALIMKRHGIRVPIVLQVAVTDDFSVSAMGCGGVVCVIHPGLVRRMGTDALARLMLERFS